jgi:hypothetical protein
MWDYQRQIIRRQTCTNIDIGGIAVVGIRTMVAGGSARSRQSRQTPAVDRVELAGRLSATRLCVHGTLHPGDLFGTRKAPHDALVDAPITLLIPQILLIAGIFRMSSFPKRGPPRMAKVAAGDPAFTTSSRPSPQC